MVRHQKVPTFPNTADVFHFQDPKQFSKNTASFHGWGVGGIQILSGEKLFLKNNKGSKVLDPSKTHTIQGNGIFTYMNLFMLMVFI